MPEKAEPRSSRWDTQARHGKIASAPSSLAVCRRDRADRRPCRPGDTVDILACAGLAAWRSTELIRCAAGDRGICRTHSGRHLRRASDRLLPRSARQPPPAGDAGACSTVSATAAASACRRWRVAPGKWLLSIRPRRRWPCSQPRAQSSITGYRVSGRGAARPMCSPPCANSISRRVLRPRVLDPPKFASSVKHAARGPCLQGHQSRRVAAALVWWP